MYNKYKYHHEILVYLNEKYQEYEKLKKDNKDIKESDEDGVVINKFYDNYCFPEWISEDLKIDTYKIKEALVDLNELGFVDYKYFKYSSKENTITYIRSNYFKNKRKSYLKKTILNDGKDILLILVSISALISPFIMSKIECNTYEKDLQQLQSQVESIKLEQTKIQATQKLILSDSLFLKHMIDLNYQNKIYDNEDN